MHSHFHQQLVIINTSWAEHGVLAQPLLLFFGLTFFVILIYTFLTMNMVLSTSALKSNADHL